MDSIAKVLHSASGLTDTTVTTGDDDGTAREVDSVGHFEYVLWGEVES